MPESLSSFLPFLLLTPSHKPAGWGCTVSWEWAQLTQLTPAGQRSIPNQLGHAQHVKLGRRRKAGDIQNHNVCLSKKMLCVMEPCFLGMTEHLSHGNSELIPCFALFVHGFCFPC